MSTPDPTSTLVTPERRIEKEWFLAWRQILARLSAAETLLGTTPTPTTPDDSDDETSTAAFAVKTQAFSESGFIEIPDDKDYTFVGIQINGTITAVEAVSTAGTCDLEVLVDGVAIDGGENSVTTTASTVVHDTDITAGSDWVVRISSNAASENVSFTISGTRTLD